MTAPTCLDCGTVLRAPGRTGRCVQCAIRLPKSPETRARMRAAALEREADYEYRERRQAAAQAGIARAMQNPVERERRAAWGRELGRRYGLANAAGPAGSPQRIANGRKASATKLAWCPMEYRPMYRDLTKVRGIASAEARRMVLDQVEADRRTYERTGRLPHAARAGR